MRRSPIAFATVLCLAAMPAWATTAPLTQRPSPATLSACQKWADSQDEDAIYMWGTRESGGSLKELAVSRLTSFCLGDEKPEISAFGSSAGYDRAFCARHRKAAICSRLR